MSPFAHALSIFVPIYGVWQAYRHFALIDTLRRKVDPAHGVDALTGAIGTGIWWLTFTHYSTEPIFVALDAIELVAGAALVMYGQRALNGYWRARPGHAGGARSMTQLDWLALGVAAIYALLHAHRHASPGRRPDVEHPRRRLARVRRRANARRASHQRARRRGIVLRDRGAPLRAGAARRRHRRRLPRGGRRASARPRHRPRRPRAARRQLVPLARQVRLRDEHRARRSTPSSACSPTGSRTCPSRSRTASSCSSRTSIPRSSSRRCAASARRRRSRSTR